VIHQTHQLGIPVHQFPDRRLALASVFAERESDVVVEVHRTELGAILEENPELLAYLVEALLTQAHDLVALHPDLAAFGTKQPENVLEQHPTYRCRTVRGSP